MDSGENKINRFIAIFFILFLSTLSIFLHPNSAKASCESVANTLDPTGSAATVCSMCTKKDGSRRGAMWATPASGSYIEIDGTSDRVHGANLYGGVYSCDNKNADGMDAHSIAFYRDSNQNTKDLAISVQSGPLDRNTYNYDGAGKNKWYYGNNYKEIYFEKTFFDVGAGKSTHNSSTGSYTRKVYIYRCNNKNSCGIYGAFLNITAYKIARFDNNGASISYNGSTYTNGSTIEVPSGTTSISVSASHSIKRTDGWTTEAGSTKYGWNTAVKSTALSINGNSSNSISDSYTISDISTTAKDFCSTVYFYNVTGLSGYNKQSGNGSSSVCVKVKQRTPVTIDAEIPIYGSSSVSKTEIYLPYAQSAATVDFSHKISRDDSYDFSRNIAFSITNSENSTYNESGTASLSQTNKFHTVSHNITIGVNPGDSKKVCETLSWNPQKITFKVTDGIYNPTTLADITGTKTTSACVTVTREEPKEDLISENSNVTITSVSDSNGNNTRVGLASIKRANGVFSYNATFSHKLSIAEILTGSDVNFSIYLVKNGNTEAPGAPSLISTGTVNFSSASDQWLLLPGSTPNVYPITVGGTETKSLCQYVVYTPSGYLKSKAGDNADGNGISITSKMVCAEVAPPDPVPGEITATSSAHPLYDKIGLNTSTGRFHFSHMFFNKNELNLPLSTTYTINVDIKTELDNDDGTVSEPTFDKYRRAPQSGGTYLRAIASGGTLLQNIPANTSYTTPVVDQFDYNVPQGSTVTICESVEFTFNLFALTDSTISGSGTGYSDKDCMSISRPRLTWYDDDNFSLTGSTQHVFSGTTEKLYPNSGNDRLLGSTNDISMNFSHIIEYPYKDNRARVENVLYAYEDSDLDSSSVSFSGGLNTFLDPGDKATLSAGISNFPNKIAVNNLKVGETQRNCRKIYFKARDYIVSHSYITLHGVKQSEEIQSTAQRPVENTVGSSDLVCASVTRPYNFHIESSSLSKKSPLDTVYYGDTISSTSYSFNIRKSQTPGEIDWNQFYISGIPDAKIQFLAITIDDSIEEFPDRFDTIGGREGEVEPCSFYQTSISGLPSLFGHVSCGIIEEKTPADHYNIGKGSGPLDAVPYYNDSELDSGVYSHTYSSSSYAVGKYTSTSSRTTIEPLSPGSKFCTALAVAPSDSGDNRGSTSDFTNHWVYSTISCANVGKKPTLQVYGGSVYSPQGISTSKSILTIDDRKTYFGSWGDFSLISPNIITGMASGAALSKGLSNEANNCNYSPLTIANSACKNSSDNSNLGGATTVSRSKNSDFFFDSLASRYIDPFDLEDSPSDRYASISGYGKILNDSAKNIILYYSKTGDITITENLEATCDSDGCSDRRDIPQILILSGKNININENVEQIDALLVAKDTVNTCTGWRPYENIWKTESGDRLDTRQCQNPLKINGPIISNKIFLPRTYGADPSVAVDSEGDPGEGNAGLNLPAELINFTPSTILWSYDQATANGIPKVTILNQLSPRY